jgi:uncharacterized Ntn-hydrolase superfamily protein
MTYSIVARDPATGALGVAVQTCMFAVGSGVPWARAGVGAVATQAIGEPAYGPRCLDAIEAGGSASAALADAQAADPAAFLRQVGVVAADRSVAAATGELCVDHAGHLLGDGFAVQANMMANSDVWPAMAEAFTASTAVFPRRLLAALEAGQAAGGDARGMMAAAMLVVEAEPTAPGGGKLVDVRVDRSDDPLGDLADLLAVSEAFTTWFRALNALRAGQPDVALAGADEALGLLPGEENFRLVRSGALAATGDVDGARTEMRALLAARPTWEVVVRSLAAKGMLFLPDGLTIDALLA